MRRLGTALNTADPTLWPRWLMMLGLALTTTAAYIVVDSGLFASDASEAYRGWVPRFALKLYTAGMVWFAVTACCYVFGTWSAGVRQHMFSGPMLVLTVLTALSPGLPCVFIVMQVRAGGVRRSLALATPLAQFDVVALNAASRQVIQNVELSRFLDVTAEPVRMQWSPLILFLVLFVAGLAVIAWMIKQLGTAEPQPQLAEPLSAEQSSTRSALQPARATPS